MYKLKRCVREKKGQRTEGQKNRCHLYTLENADLQRRIGVGEKYSGETNASGRKDAGKISESPDPDKSVSPESSWHVLSWVFFFPFS